MRKSQLLLGAALASGLMLAAAPAAHASPITPFVFTMTQAGPNVVLNGSGAIDVTGLTLFESVSSEAAPVGVVPDDSQVVSGDTTLGFDAYDGTLSGPTSFGSGNQTASSSVSGGVAGSYVNEGYVVVPYEYQSGTFFTNSETFDDATFASLGVTPGTYTWTWGAGAEQSITLDVTTTPEPAPLLLLATGLLAGLLLFRKRVFVPDC